MHCSAMPSLLQHSGTQRNLSCFQSSKSRRAVYSRTRFPQSQSPRTVPSQRSLLRPALGGFREWQKRARRFPLVDGDSQPVRGLVAAKKALEIKGHERRENKLPTAGRKPLFADYCETYFGKAKVQRKRPGTIENEKQAVARWCDHLGHVRIDRIATAIIASYVDRRLKGGIFCGRKLGPVSERTVQH
jgi:hypothetical protein